MSKRHILSRQNLCYLQADQSHPPQFSKASSCLVFVNSSQFDLHPYFVFTPPGLLVIKKLILPKATVPLGVGNPTKSKQRSSITSVLVFSLNQGIFSKR